MSINFLDLPDEIFSILTRQTGIGPELAKTSKTINRVMEETVKTCLNDLQTYTREHRENFLLIDALQVSENTRDSIQRIGQK